MRSFFHWWFQQLTSLVPASIRRRWRSRNATVTFFIEKDTLHLLSHDGTSQASINLGAAQKGQVGPEQLLSNHLPGNPGAFRIRLAPGEFLVRRLTLPASARAHLAEAVGYQLPKLTPFNAEQVFYACGMDGSDQDSVTDNVWLIVVPRQRIAVVLNALGLKHPGELLDVDEPPGPGESLEFVWHVLPAQAGSMGTRRLLWMGAIAMLAVPLGLHVHYKFKQYQTYSRTLEGLRSEVKEVARVRDRVTQVTDRLERLNREKRSVVAPLRVMEDLTNSLEDDTWLQNLEIKGGRLLLQGLSPTPASLIELLERRPFLNNVRFESAITQGRGQQVSRFSISADLVSPSITEDR